MWALLAPCTRNSLTQFQWSRSLQNGNFGKAILKLWNSTASDFRICLDIFCGDNAWKKKRHFYLAKGVVTPYLKDKINCSSSTRTNNDINMLTIRIQFCCVPFLAFVILHMLFGLQRYYHGKFLNNNYNQLDMYARFIRIKSRVYLNAAVCMRFDLYGAPLPNLAGKLYSVLKNVDDTARNN